MNIAESIVERTAGGGGFYPLRVKETIRETAHTTSVVFEVPAEWRERFRYRAGQYVVLRVPQRERRHYRCYSLSEPPDADAALKVTVKRVAGGLVSNWINGAVRPGDVLDVMPPRGRFIMTEKVAALYCFAAGSGITPIAALIGHYLRHSRGRCHLLYANPGRDNVIFSARLRDWTEAYGERFRLEHWPVAERGYLDEAHIAERVRRESDATFYLCGPVPFMAAVQQGLRRLGVPPERVHTENFTAPDETLDRGEEAALPAAATDAALTLHLRGETVALRCRPNETVLEAALRTGVDIPHSCTRGICGACMAYLREGTVSMRSHDILTDAEIAEGAVLACQAVPEAARCRLEFAG